MPNANPNSNPVTLYYCLLFFIIFFYHDFYDFIIFTAYSQLIFLYEEMSVRLDDKSQSKCSFIVRPRYLTCVVREIYWPLFLKFGCFITFLLGLSLNIKISEYQIVE